MPAVGFYPTVVRSNRRIKNRAVHPETLTFFSFSHSLFQPPSHRIGDFMAGSAVSPAGLAGAVRRLVPHGHRPPPVGRQPPESLSFSVLLHRASHGGRRLRRFTAGASPGDLLLPFLLPIYLGLHRNHRGKHRTRPPMALAGETEGDGAPAPPSPARELALG
jgi:hypothetical protein